MAWTNSKIFAAFVKEALDRTKLFDVDGDTFKIALYNNSVTPDNSVTAANAAYNAGVWGVANEQDDTTNWDAGGEPLTSVTLTQSTTTVTFDAADTSQGGATCTLANVFGGLVYDDTVSDVGISYNYFGGSNGVTGGTFTVQYNASGICSFSFA